MSRCAVLYFWQVKGFPISLWNRIISFVRKTAVGVCGGSFRQPTLHLCLYLYGTICNVKDRMLENRQGSIKDLTDDAKRTSPLPEATSPRSPVRDPKRHPSGSGAAPGRPLSGWKQLGSRSHRSPFKFSWHAFSFGVQMDKTFHKTVDPPIPYILSIESYCVFGLSVVNSFMPPLSGFSSYPPFYPLTISVTMFRHGFVNGVALVAVLSALVDAAPSRRDTTISPSSICNTPSNRSCWAPGFDINTDWEKSTPFTGVTRTVCLAGISKHSRFRLTGLVLLDSY
jgi:hypothetical protein